MVSMASLACWFDSEEYQGSHSSPGVAYTNYSKDEAHRVAEARIRYQRDLAPLLLRRSRILEVGCATGSLLSVLRDEGHQVTGIDLSERFIRAARALYGLDVILGDFMTIPLPEASFDAIVLMGTVSNLRFLNDSLKRMRKLLRRGGVLIFNFSNADSVWVRVFYREGFWMFTPSAPTFMTVRGCTTVLANAGFNKVSIRNDLQRPSFRKLLHHGKADFLLPVINALSLADAALPLAIPMPTIKLVIAHSYDNT